jgi:hypothetical protein
VLIWYFADLLHTGDLIVSFRKMTFSRKACQDVPYSSALFWLLRWKYDSSSTTCQDDYSSWNRIWQNDYRALNIIIAQCVWRTRMIIGHCIWCAWMTALWPHIFNVDTRWSEWLTSPSARCACEIRAPDHTEYESERPSQPVWTFRKMGRLPQLAVIAPNWQILFL